MPGFSSRTPCPANLFEPFFWLFRHRMHPPAGCVPTVRAARRPAAAIPRRKKKPPCNCREVGDKGLWETFGIIIDGKLVNPLNIIYVKIIFWTPVHIISIGICGTWNYKRIIPICWFGSLVVPLDLDFGILPIWGRSRFGEPKWAITDNLSFPGIFCSFWIPCPNTAIVWSKENICRWNRVLCRPIDNRNKNTCFILGVFFQWTL